jgi:hypothetical protein
MPPCNGKSFRSLLPGLVEERSFNPFSPSLPGFTRLVPSIDSPLQIPAAEIGFTALSATSIAPFAKHVATPVPELLAQVIAPRPATTSSKSHAAWAVIRIA